MTMPVAVLQTAAPSAPLRVARDVWDLYFNHPRSLAFWQETWWSWDRTSAVWSQVSDIAIDHQLYEILGDAMFTHRQGAQAQLMRWEPSTSKINNVRAALASIAGIPDAVRPGDWLDGSQQRAIPCRGGYIGWNPHTANTPIFGWEMRAADPNLFNTASLTVDYDPFADEVLDGEGDIYGDAWLEFLNQIFDGDQDGIACLQEWTGYLISGRTDLQVMLQLLGPKRSGKGTYQRVLAALYGQALGATSMDALGYRFGLQGALATPLLVMGDARADKGVPALAIERLLGITGEDPIRIDIKHGEGITTRLPCRIMVLANGVLKLPDTAGALDARSVFVRTRRSFVGHEDRTLSQRLTTPASLRAVLLWALAGLERLDASGGRFTVQDAAAADRELARELSNPLSEFLNDRYRQAPGARSVTLSALHDEYLNWRMHTTLAWRQTQKQTESELKQMGMMVSRPKDADKKSMAPTVYDIELKEVC